jgi:mono/diheme cytochrome c family protein
MFLLGGSTFVAPMMAGDAPTAQTQRGRELFLHSPKGLACATCHSLDGNGNSIGPDLTRLGSVVGPKGLVMTIQMTMTAYVQEIQLQNGRAFPGIQKGKEGDLFEIYDLSKTPAILLKLKASDVASMKPNTKWSHPPTSAGYTPNELADIIAYLKFVSTGVAKEVKVTDLH